MSSDSVFRDWDFNWTDWSPESRQKLAEDDARPRIDMSTWTPAQEERLMAELEKARQYLADNGQDVSLYELRRYWGVANAYRPGERNLNIPQEWNFTVHEIFTRVPDRALRQEMLMSRDDWTVQEAKEAVRALDKITPPDAEHRARFS